MERKIELNYILYWFIILSQNFGNGFKEKKKGSSLKLEKNDLTMDHNQNNSTF